MKKTSLIILGIIVSYFVITIGIYLSTEEKELTKEEAIALGDSLKSRPDYDKRFSTKKDSYKINEDAIIYEDGVPLVRWNFKKVTTVKEDDITNFEDLIQDNIIRIELEIENLNYIEPYDPDVSTFISHFITDKGESLIQTASLPTTSIKRGEKKVFTYFFKTKKSGKKIDKIYVQYYYMRQLFDFSWVTYSNHLDFELTVTH